MNERIEAYLQLALDEIRKNPRPIPLIEHIRDKYNGSVKRFADDTGRSTSSVHHQLARNAIWFKDTIYCPEGRKS